MSEVYRGYIDALSKGENYSLKKGLIDAVIGGGESLLFEKYAPKVSLSGGNYFGAVRGPNASTLKGAFTGSHFLNGLTQTAFDTAQKVTSTVLGNLSSRTVASSISPSILNPIQATPSGGARTSNPNTINAGQPLTISGGGGATTTYTVKSGDTLGNIGSRFGTTATAIGAANGIQNLNLIRPGQVLRVRP